MKKILTAVAMAGTLLMGCAAVGAMDSTTLLNNPDRYRVVSTQPDGVVYVDMDSIKSMQTRDFPNSIENISCTLYVEKYNSTLDAMTFQQNQVIRQINEYSATLHGNKRDNTYDLKAELLQVYSPQGEAKEISIDTIQFKNYKDMSSTLIAWPHCRSSKDTFSRDARGLPHVTRAASPFIMSIQQQTKHALSRRIRRVLLYVIL